MFVGVHTHVCMQVEAGAMLAISPSPSPLDVLNKDLSLNAEAVWPVGSQDLSLLTHFTGLTGMDTIILNFLHRF